MPLVQRRPLIPYPVYLRDIVAGGVETVGKLPVVGEEQKSRGVIIESSHGGYLLVPVVSRNEICHGLQPFILHGGEDFVGLIQQQVDILPVLDLPSVDPDVLVSFHVKARVLDHGPVHGDFTALYHLLEFRPCGNARIRQHLIQSHNGIIPILRCIIIT